MKTEQQTQNQSNIKKSNKIINQHSVKNIKKDLKVKLPKLRQKNEKQINKNNANQDLLSSLPLEKDNMESYVKKFNEEVKYCPRIHMVPLTDEQLLYVNEILNIQLTDTVVDMLRMLSTTKKIKPIFTNEYEENCFNSFLKYNVKYLIFLEDISIEVKIDNFCIEHEIDNISTKISMIKKKQKTCQIKLEFQKISQYEYFKEYFQQKKFQIKSLTFQNQSETVLSTLKKLFKQFIITQKSDQKLISDRTGLPESLKKGEQRQSEVRKISPTYQVEESIHNGLQDDQSQQQMEIAQQLNVDQTVKLIPSEHTKKDSISNVSDNSRTEALHNRMQEEFQEERQEKENLKAQEFKIMESDRAQIEGVKKIDPQTQYPQSDIIAYIIEFHKILCYMTSNSKHLRLSIFFPGNKKILLSELKKEHQVFFEKANQFLNNNTQINNDELTLFKSNYQKSIPTKSTYSFIFNKLKNEKNFSLNHLGDLKFFKK